MCLVVVVVVVGNLSGQRCTFLFHVVGSVLRLNWLASKDVRRTSRLELG